MMNIIIGFWNSYQDGWTHELGILAVMWNR